MSQLPVGEVLGGDCPPFTLSLPPGHAFVWREGEDGARAMIWHPGARLPSAWESAGGWKVIGDEDTIKTLAMTSRLPPGSKTIVTRGPCQIQANIPGKSVKWSGQRRKRALIVDDSATMRKLIHRMITSFEDWEVIDELENAEGLPAALDALFPDLVTLDMHMGKIDGLTAIKRFLAPRKTPTILVTSSPRDASLVMEALEAGALDYLQKPESGNWDAMVEELSMKMDAALKSKWRTMGQPSSSSFPALDFPLASQQLIVIGSSTGGTQAVEEILKALPAKIPPVLVTQHIPPIFSKAFAERLNQTCQCEVKEAEEGDEIRPGRVLIAPGGHHMELAKGGLSVKISDAEPVNRFRPSVDHMFMSVAKHARQTVVGVILTGMGKDGAAGLLQLKTNGAVTIGQDEATCVVYGMPKEAARIGAVTRVEPLGNIARALAESCMGKKRS